MGDWLERGLRFFPVLLYSACAAAYSQGTMYRGQAFSAQRVFTIPYGTLNGDKASHRRLVRQSEFRRDLTKWRVRSRRGADDATSGVPRRPCWPGRQHR